ncbi:sporulation histidine kinase inhibitor Sda [Paenibacillus solisilvae]|uniref:Sporulation histidine kinase inhibitor Sda n=1 Tax=Paenibacillus solisilvae TaxID=2486751 RepID=A0ABW0W6S5_9BACL
MEVLSDELLIDAYHSAILFDLEPDFIQLLSAEMIRRELNPDLERITA